MSENEVGEINPQQALAGRLLPVTLDDNTIQAYIDPSQVICLRVTDGNSGWTQIVFATDPAANFTIRTSIANVRSQLGL